MGGTFVALCVIWGLPYFFIKIALTEVAPACVAWARVMLGAAVLLPLAWKRGALATMGRHKGAVCAFALAELIGPFFLIALGESWVSSSLAGILIATVPLIVIVLGPVFGTHEPLSARRLIGLVTGLSGVMALLGFDTVHGTLGWIGVACIVVSTIGYALGSLIVQRHLSDVDEMGAVAVSLALASVALLIPAAVSMPSRVPSPLVLISIIVLGVVCSALALSLYFFLISHVGAARASVITYVNPAVAALLGVLVLHESFGPGALLGLALILVGSWLATHGRPLPVRPAQD
ncbi:MAG TPA: EamA family transporter [Steroidobacteraceae bacterium]|nr:EamA family transporter [Steroidobacteraceae bacterium]